MKKTVKIKVRKGLQAMRTRKHKNRFRADKVKGESFFDSWMDKRFEEMKEISDESSIK